jgi:predicted nucleotidyltransferase
MSRIKKMPDVDQIREALAPVFRDEGLRLVLLFGSVATGIAHRRSDIDLAFLFDTPTDVLALTNAIVRLLGTDNIDVVDLRRASPLLKFSAAKHGKVLYEKTPGVFPEFYSLAFRMYDDTRKLREAKARSIRTFLESRGLR